MIAEENSKVSEKLKHINKEFLGEIDKYKAIVELADKKEYMSFFHTFQIVITTGDYIAVDKKKISDVNEFINYFSGLCGNYGFSFARKNNLLCACMHSHDSDMRIGHYNVYTRINLDVIKKYAQENF